MKAKTERTYSLGLGTVEDAWPTPANDFQARLREAAARLAAAEEERLDRERARRLAVLRPGATYFFVDATTKFTPLLGDVLCRCVDVACSPHGLVLVDAGHLGIDALHAAVTAIGWHGSLRDGSYACLDAQARWSVHRETVTA